jgi:hypothetical protein
LQAEFLTRSQIDTKLWDTVACASPQGSIFMHSGYLDAVLDGKWSGIVVKDDSEILALMPLNINSRLGIHTALQPFFTKYWGIAFADKTFSKTHKEYSWKKKVCNAMIKAIPRNIPMFDYNFHPGFDYPLPFTWNGFHLSPKFTYRIDCAGKTESDIFKEYTDSLKNSIRAAQKEEFRIIEDSGTNALVEVMRENEKQGKKIMDSRLYGKWADIYNFCKAGDKGFSLTILDKDNRPLASSLYLRDDKHVYALAHNAVPNLNQAGVLSLLVHSAIKKSAELNLNFDFLGSMNESFEAFNRRFGARPVPYYNISKKNKLLKLIGR